MDGLKKNFLVLMLMVVITFVNKYSIKYFATNSHKVAIEPAYLDGKINEIKQKNIDSTGYIEHRRILCEKGLINCHSDILDYDIIGIKDNFYTVKFFFLTKKECHNISQHFQHKGYKVFTSRSCSRWFYQNGVKFNI